MRSRTIDAGGVPVFSYEWGEQGRPAVLYWDGLGGCGLHANELAPILVEEYGLRVIAPDPPGHGRSPGLPLDAYRPSSLACLVANLLLALEIDQVAFIGFSWGAEIACAFGATYPQQTTKLALVDGGHWDFADLPHVDTTADLESWVAGARRRATDGYDSWDAYLAAESTAIGRWTPALEAAHRAMMHESGGRITPTLTADVTGAIHYGNCVEPTVATHASLRATGVPLLLLTPAEPAPEAVARRGISRFQANVPQLRVVELSGSVHDLVSAAAPEVAAIAGSWLCDGLD